jgi:hypothetical protein
MRRSRASDGGRAIGRAAWLLPSAYAAHVLEEAFGGRGLMAWMAAGGGMRFSLVGFLSVNLLGLVLLGAATWIAMRSASWRWPLIAGTTIILVNGVCHVEVVAATRAYVPGLWTGVVLYVPLGVFLLMRWRHAVSTPVLAAGIAAGFIIHGAVLWVAFRMPGFRLA